MKIKVKTKDGRIGIITHETETQIWVKINRIESAYSKDGK